MRVLVAMDSFKGSLSALEATTTVALALSQSIPSLVIETCPLADGGEGSLEVLLTHHPGGIKRQAVCTGPLPRTQVQADVGWWQEEKWAVIEAAQACGLPLLQQGERDPWNATSQGVGELLLLAQEFGAEKITVTLGGTATMDGGIGLAHALGWLGEDSRGKSLSPSPSNIPLLQRLIPPQKPFAPEPQIWADVRTPILGSQGCASLFGPQKGATPEQVLQLKARFEKLNDLWQALGHNHLASTPGGGAAGGLAAGLIAFCGAGLQFGAEQLVKIAQLEKKIQNADWVITGEGQFDETTLQNKCVQKVAELAVALGKPFLVLAGWLKIDPAILGAAAGFSASHSQLSEPPSPKDARQTLQTASLKLGQFITRHTK